MQMPGLLHSNVIVMFPEMSNVMFVCVCIPRRRGRGSQNRFVSLFVCLLVSTKRNRTVCKLFPLFLFHPFHSFILPLPHKTHLHFTINLQYLNDFRFQVIYVTNVQNGNCKEAYIKPVGV